MVFVKYINFHKIVPIHKNSHLRERCYLCNTTYNLTIEHVIPRIMFKTSLDSNDLITNKLVELWACGKCNRDKGYEDEYAVRYLQTTSFVKPSLAGFERFVASAKAGRRGRGIVFEMVKNYKKVPVNILGKDVVSDAVLIDMPRLEKFLLNIAKGLHVRCFGKFVNWAEYEIDVVLDQLVQNMLMYEAIMAIIENYSERV